MTSKATKKSSQNEIGLISSSSNTTRVLDKVVIIKAKAIAKNRAKAKAFLNKAGITTKSGNLTSHYK